MSRVRPTSRSTALAIISTERNDLRHVLFAVFTCDIFDHFIPRSWQKSMSMSGRLSRIEEAFEQEVILQRISSVMPSA